MDQGNEKSAAPTVVIGAGVVGLATAFRLARVLPKVVLIDRGEPGMGCSFGNAGHIATEQIFPLASPETVLQAPRLLFSSNSPLSIRPSYAASITPWLLRFAWASRPSAYRRGIAALDSLQKRAIDALESLCEDARIVGQLHRRGHLILVEAPGNVTKAHRQIETLREHGISASWLSASEVAERAPRLKSASGAIHVHDTAHVGDPLALSRELLRAFTVAGGQLLQDEVRGVTMLRDEGIGLRLSSEEIIAGRIVVAAGIGSRHLAAQTGFDVPLDTERGYHVQAHSGDAGLDIAVASMDRMTIMTPLSTGLRMTGFVEFGGVDAPPHPARLATLHRHLNELLPDVNLTDRTEWLGFRPSLPDHLPVIGRHPGEPRILYAFGHQHLGLTLAGVTAKIITELATTGQATIDLSPFRVDRFS
jgi:D-amino-acid dehydrogenase